jgi:hypothetical protein
MKTRKEKELYYASWSRVHGGEVERIRSEKSGRNTVGKWDRPVLGKLKRLPRETPMWFQMKKSVQLTHSFFLLFNATIKPFLSPSQDSIELWRRQKTRKRTGGCEVMGREGIWEHRIVDGFSSAHWNTHFSQKDFPQILIFLWDLPTTILDDIYPLFTPAYKSKNGNRLSPPSQK